MGESRSMPEPRHEALGAKSESKAHNARELRAKPKSRAKSEIDQREGFEEGDR